MRPCRRWRDVELVQVIQTCLIATDQTGDGDRPAVSGDALEITNGRC